MLLYICLIWQILPLFIEERWSSVDFFRILLASKVKEFSLHEIWNADTAFLLGGSAVYESFRLPSYESQLHYPCEGTLYLLFYFKYIPMNLNRSHHNLSRILLCTFFLFSFGNMRNRTMKLYRKCQMESNFLRIQKLLQFTQAVFLARVSSLG